MKFLTATLIGLALAASSQDPSDVGFGSLAGFDYEEGMELPADVTKWDGESIKISGFMRREEDDGGDGPVTTFMLIYDQCGCEGMPKMNEIIFCVMPEGETTEIGAGVATVTGTLYVGEAVDEDVVVSLYTLDVESVGS